MLTRSNKRQRVEQELLTILDVVASNGWFPWHAENTDGSKDHDSLRLVTKDIKKLVDQPSHGGADFFKIADLLHDRNGFDLDEGGFCHHCHENWDAPEENRCDTCSVYNGECHNYCECKEDHRFGSIVMIMDPRLQEAHLLSPRQLVKKFLNFHQWCVSNFLGRFSDSNGDLTMADPSMWYSDVFSKELAQYNEKTNNFFHNLLFIGWSHQGLSLSGCPPGSYDPYRPGFLGQPNEEDWNGGHRETFNEITDCFLRCHKAASGEKTLLVHVCEIFGHEKRFPLSQIQHIPAVIQHCVKNSFDTEAVDLLGTKLASSIDLYRPARETLLLYEGTGALDIKWMPCLGMPKEDFVTLTSYGGYNPQTDHIIYTGLRPGLK